MVKAHVLGHDGPRAVSAYSGVRLVWPQPVSPPPQRLVSALYDDDSDDEPVEDAPVASSALPAPAPITLAEACAVRMSQRWWRRTQRGARRSQR